MSARVWQVGGVAAVGGIGYYMYSAGGNPKVAEKKMEGKRGHSSYTSHMRTTNDAPLQLTPPSFAPT